MVQQIFLDKKEFTYIMQMCAHDFRHDFLDKTRVQPYLNLAGFEKVLSGGRKKDHKMRTEKKQSEKKRTRKKQTEKRKIRKNITKPYIADIFEEIFLIENLMDPKKTIKDIYKLTDNQLSIFLILKSLNKEFKNYQSEKLKLQGKRVWEEFRQTQMKIPTMNPLIVYGGSEQSNENLQQMNSSITPTMETRDIFGINTTLPMSSFDSQNPFSMSSSIVPPVASMVPPVASMVQSDVNSRSSSSKTKKKKRKRVDDIRDQQTNTRFLGMDGRRCSRRRGGPPKSYISPPDDIEEKKEKWDKELELYDLILIKNMQTCDISDRDGAVVMYDYFKQNTNLKLSQVMIERYNNSGRKIPHNLEFMGWFVKYCGLGMKKVIMKLRSETGLPFPNLGKPTITAENWKIVRVFCLNIIKWWNDFINELFISPPTSPVPNPDISGGAIGINDPLERLINKVQKKLKNGGCDDDQMFLMFKEYITKSGTEQFIKQTGDGNLSLKNLQAINVVNNGISKKHFAMDKHPLKLFNELNDECFSACIIDPQPSCPPGSNVAGGIPFHIEIICHESLSRKIEIQLTNQWILILKINDELWVNKDISQASVVGGKPPLSVFNIVNDFINNIKQQINYAIMSGVSFETLPQYLKTIDMDEKFKSFAKIFSSKLCGDFSQELYAIVNHKNFFANDRPSSIRYMFLKKNGKKINGTNYFDDKTMGGFTAVDENQNYYLMETI